MSRRVNLNIELMQYQLWEEGGQSHLIGQSFMIGCDSAVSKNRFVTRKSCLDVLI